MAARAALALSTKGANKGICAELQGDKGETKVLEPLLGPLAGTPFCGGTFYWNLARTPFRRWNPCWNPRWNPPFYAGIPAGSHLCALLVIFGNAT